MPITYALANQKGGVGKTTTAVNVGACLAEQGQRVLIVDVDPQANATSSLGFDKREVSPSVYDLLVDDASPAQIILPTCQEDLDLIPSSPDLAGATVEMVELPQRERRLRVAMSHLETVYDYVLIDCPPSLGVLTINALVATNAVIIPVQCEYLALEGLSQLARAIELVRRALNPGLRLRGLVMTMYDARTTLSRQVVEDVRNHFPGRVFDTIIPRNVRLSEAPSYGQPISVYAPSSTGGLAYAALAQELLVGDGIRQPQAVEPADTRIET
jgi:chromosome partitioning protein